MANARVEDEAIAQLLTPDVAERIVRAYARERGLVFQPQRAGEGAFSSIVGYEYVTVERGAVTSYNRRITDELTAALTAAGEALFAAQVQRVLARRAVGGRVSSRAVDVEQQGERERAYVLEFEVRR